MTKGSRTFNVKQATQQESGVKRIDVSTRTLESQTNTSDLVADEVPVAFVFNGNSGAVMMASPLNLDDFAIGFSLTEKIIDTADDIKQIEVRRAKQGYTIELQIQPHLIERLANKSRQITGRSGCGVCGIADLASAIPELDPLPKTQAPNHAVVQQAITSFKAMQTIQQQTGSVHGAALCDQNGDILCAREDIGRHNALDKLIGANIGATQPEHFILLSSRASHELVVKTVIAGAGSLVCISAATSLAVELAEKTNLNLIGFIRDQRQIIYSSE